MSFGDHFKRRVTKNLYVIKKALVRVEYPHILFKRKTIIIVSCNLSIFAHKIKCSFSVENQCYGIRMASPTSPKLLRRSMHGSKGRSFWGDCTIYNDATNVSFEAKSTGCASRTVPPLLQSSVVEGGQFDSKI